MQTLTVTAVGFISSLFVTTLNIASLVIGQITGSPNLDINVPAGIATVNGDEILTTVNVKNVTGKTLDVSANSIIMDNIVGSPNITDTVTQQMRTTDNVTFGSVSTVGGVFAGSGCQGLFGHFNTVNSQAVDNTCTVNGVNPLTTDTNLNNHIAASTAHGTTSTIVGINDVQRMTNKNLAVPSCKLVDNSDSTKVISFNDAAATTGTTLTIFGGQTANRSLTLPDATDTIVARATTDTLTNKTLDTAVNTITLTNLFLTGAPINNILGQAVRTIDSPSFADITLTAAPNNNAITNILGLDGSNLVSYKNNIADTSAAQTFTNKSFDDTTCAFVDTADNTKKILFNAGGTTATTTTLTCAQTGNRIITFPDSSTTVVGTNAIQTLTNKTLTAPTISTITNGGTLTLPSSSDTLVARNTTDTLTNKTINSGSNTIQVSAAANANINSLLDQDVRTTANPSFTTFVHLLQSGNASFEISSKGDLAYSGAAGSFFTNSALGDINVRNQDSTKTLNLGVSNATAQLQISNTVTKNVVTSIDDYVSNTLKAKSTFPISTSSAAGATTTLLTVPVATNTSVVIFLYLSTRKLTGTITGYGSYIYDWKGINNAGTVTTTNGNNQAKSEQAIAGGFGGKTTLSVAVSTTNINVNIANSFLDGTLIEAGYIEVLFS